MTQISTIMEKLVQKKSFRIKATGNSMLPLLKPEDIVFINTISFEKIRVNDIVFVHKKNTSFIHRVIYRKFVKKRIQYVITKGDNNNHADGHISSPHIYGIVSKIQRGKMIIGIDELYLLQSSIYLTEIIKIGNAFTKYKIDYVILKGLPLHIYYSHTHPRRIYADCDILVKNQNIAFISKIFSKHGYRTIQSEFSPIHKKFKDHYTEISFIKNSLLFPVTFDIHFEPIFMLNQLGKLESLYPQKLIEQITDKFLREKRIVTVEHVPFPVLSTENLIMYLSYHIFRHNFKEIHRYELLHRIWQTTGIKTRVNFYHRVRNEILMTKLNNFIYPVFIFLIRYFNTPIPKQFLTSIRPDKHKLDYINKNILTSDIFESEQRITAGIQRFKNVWALSPLPFYLKCTTIFNLSVLYMGIWLLIKKLRNSLTARLHK
jgi:signal peptidase I